MMTSRSSHPIASFVAGLSTALTALSATGAAGATAAEMARQTSIGDCRPMSPEFAGINAKMLISDPWNTDWADALKLTGVGNIRYPGGTAGNDWDWKLGRSERHQDYSYLPAQVKPAADQAGVTPMWVMNIITRDIQHGLDGLAEAASAGLPIRWVEIGNELYLGRNAELFPTGKEYGQKAKEWIAAIKSVYPDAKCALSTTMKHAGDRTTNWTRDAISTCDNYDALVVHLYVWVGLEPQAPKNEKKPTAEERARQQADFDKPDGPARVIAQPLLAWRDLRRNNDLPPNADLWATEFGERDFIGATNGTWALTLFTVNQIHAFLDDGRVSRFCCQLLQNLTVPDGEEEGDTGRYNPGSPGGVGRSFHLTAMGLAINLFARHTRQADRVAPIVFSDTPLVSVEGMEPYPAIVGWKFGGAKESSAVLVNFSDQSYEVATVGFAGPEAAVKQMEGDPREPANSRLIAPKEMGSLPATLSLPPYSITEVMNISSPLSSPERRPARPVPSAPKGLKVQANTETE